MPRRSKESVSVTLTIRMTREDRELLNQLVAKRATELSDEGLEVTATSLIRGLIRREARYRGLLSPLGTPPPIGTPLPLIEPTSSDPPQEIASFPRSPAISLPTPMVPTGWATPEAPPCVIQDSSTPVPVAVRPSRDDETIDAEDVRNRAVLAIRARRLRQRDLVEHAGVSQKIVSRFLLGAQTTESRLQAISRALDLLAP